MYYYVLYFICHIMYVIPAMIFMLHLHIILSILSFEIILLSRIVQSSFLDDRYREAPTASTEQCAQQPMSFQVQDLIDFVRHQLKHCAHNQVPRHRLILVSSLIPNHQFMIHICIYRFLYNTLRTGRLGLSHPFFYHENPILTRHVSSWNGQAKWAVTSGYQCFQEEQDVAHVLVFIFDTISRVILVPRVLDYPIDFPSSSTLKKQFSLAPSKHSEFKNQQE